MIAPRYPRTDDVETLVERRRRAVARALIAAVLLPRVERHSTRSQVGAWLWFAWVLFVSGVYVYSMWRQP